MQLDSLDELDHLLESLEPSDAEEAIKAALHLAGWRRDLSKQQVGRALVNILSAIQPDPSELSIEVRRALLGWAAGNADPADLAFMELWREVLLRLNLVEGALKLVESSRARSQNPAYIDLLDRTQQALSG